jgi:hypothetical protein
MKFIRLFYIFFFILVLLLTLILYMVYAGFNFEEFINYHTNASNNYCHKLEALLAGTNTQTKEIRLPSHVIDKNIKEFTDYISSKSDYKLIQEFGFNKKYNERKNQRFLCKDNIVDFSQFFDTEKEGRVIYVGRKNSLRRRIVNEEILIKFLKNKYGDKLEILDLDKGYSMLDQAKIFNGCEIFIAVHGASIANLFFMKSNTHLIEILADGCEPHCFNQKAKNKGIKHDYLHLKDYNKSESVYKYPRDSYMKMHSNDLNNLNSLLG